MKKTTMMILTILLAITMLSENGFSLAPECKESGAPKECFKTK